jgi:hypothetical protein
MVVKLMLQVLLALLQSSWRPLRCVARTQVLENMLT